MILKHKKVTFIGTNYWKYLLGFLKTKQQNTQIFKMHASHNTGYFYNSRVICFVWYLHNENSDLPCLVCCQCVTDVVWFGSILAKAINHYGMSISLQLNTLFTECWAYVLRNNNHNSLPNSSFSIFRHLLCIERA